LIRFVAALFFFILTGFSWFGALIGYGIGTLIDFSYRFFSPRFENGEASYEYYRKSNSEEEFTLMLMALSAAVMRADGKVLKSELNFVKAFFHRNLGDRFEVSHLQMLKRFLETPGIPLEKICENISEKTQPQDRVLLLHYLFGIATADGKITQSEINVIHRISLLLGISASDYQSEKNMFVRESNSDYKVLGVDQSASNDEIKKAYRALALRFHPDKVAHLGEEHQKNAKEQFQKIQQAYEKIKLERGLV